MNLIKCGGGIGRRTTYNLDGYKRRELPFMLGANPYPHQRSDD